MQRFASVLLLSGAMIAQSAATSSLCFVPSIKLIAGVTMPGYMYVKAGKSCAIVPNNSFGGTSGVQISERPAHGSLEYYKLGVRYTPRPGYVGRDSFGYIRHGLDGRTGRPVTFPVMVEVTVQP